MAYNPYTDVYGTYKAGKAWQEETDEAKRNTIHQDAQVYYNNLKANGYEDLANELSVSDLAKRKELSDKYKTSGMTKTRDYLYSLGKSHGMSSSDVDSLIEWTDTGEVSFGGKKIGRPDALYDGASYWADTSVLDNAFNDYINRSGTARTPDALVSQENDVSAQLYRQAAQDAVNDVLEMDNINPFDTDIGKAILGKYDLAGLQGRDNAAASGASSNGGNIDSFAAANALRQQASLVNQGQLAVLEDHRATQQMKMDHVRNMLSDMGVNIDRVFDQNEIAKANDVTNKTAIASVTGETPIEWTLQNDPFYREFVDENGHLKDQYKNTDFQERINEAKANGDTETADKYAVLRGLKMSKWFNEFGQYANSGDVKYLSAKPTEEATNNAFYRDETAKNNETARLSEEAAIRGTTPTELLLKNNPYLNEDGTIKEQYKDVDFANVMANAKATGNEDAYNAAAMARYYKIMGNYGLYGQYDDGDYIAPGDVPTAAMQQFLDSMKYNYDVMENENKNSISTSPRIVTSGSTTTSGKSSGTKPSITAAQAKSALESGTTTQTVIDAYNYWYGEGAYDKWMEEKNKDKAGTKPSITASQAKSALESGTATQTVIDAYNYWYGDGAYDKWVEEKDKGKTSTTKPSITASQAKSALESGTATQAVIDAYNYYYGEGAYDKWLSGQNPDDGKKNGTGWADNTTTAPAVDYGANLDKVYSNSDKTVKDYIRNVLKPVVTTKSLTDSELKQNLLNNSKEYDLEVDDIKAIYAALGGTDTMWTDNYKNAGLFGWGSGVKEK